MTKRRMVCVWLLAMMAVGALGGCQSSEPGTLYQLSTIPALLEGVYDGQMTVAEVRRRGNFGLGTFDGLDGEMVVLDGVVYQVPFDGAVRVAPDDWTTPFYNVTTLPGGAGVAVPAGLTFLQFQAWLDGRLPSCNIPYAIRIDGVFRQVKTRSVPKQTPPYPPLEAVAKKQAVFEFQHVRGTVVGFRFPTYFQGINVPGYHLHFLSADRKTGGHLMEFTIESGELTGGSLPQFILDLPGNDAFLKANLFGDRTKQIHAVEN